MQDLLRIWNRINPPSTGLEMVMNEFDLDTFIVSGDGKNLYLAIKLKACLAPVVFGYIKHI